MEDFFTFNYFFNIFDFFNNKLINNVYFLDIFLFIYLIHYFYFLNSSFIFIFLKNFISSLNDVFSYSKDLILRRFISIFIFIFLLSCCYGGYFCYSFCPCGIIEFTLFFSLISWLRTFICFIRREKISVYFRKGGDSFLKTLSMLVVEIVREFSRPIALTVRLTVNIIVGHIIRISLFLLVEFLG